MDWRKIIEKKQIKYTLAGLGTSVIAGVIFFVGKPVALEFNDSFAMKEFKKYGVIGTYSMHYHRVFDRLESLATADRREQQLVRNLASVERDLELERAKNTEEEARKETHEIAERLHEEAGSSIARIPDDIEYEVPSQIMPHQLLTLGMEYFRKKDYEKSAVIFHSLIHSKEDDGFKKPDHYLISAISWYKLKHFEMAADYLKLTQKSAAPGSSLFRQSLLWESIVEGARGHKGASQAALTRLMSYYPQSEEAKWINHARKPASATKGGQHE